MHENSHAGRQVLGRPEIYSNACIFNNVGHRNKGDPHIMSTIDAEFSLATSVNTALLSLKTIRHMKITKLF